MPHFLLRRHRRSRGLLKCPRFAANLGGAESLRASTQADRLETVPPRKNWEKTPSAFQHLKSSLGKHYEVELAVDPEKFEADKETASTKVRALAKDVFWAASDAAAC